MKKTLLFISVLGSGMLLAETAAAQTTPIFKFWSLKANAADSAALRSPSTMTASSAVLRKFVLSNGTAAAPPKAFSRNYGMAFAPAADGGGWSTAAGGTGSTLRRYYSVQFTATAPAGTTLRADSLVMNLAFIGTVSGTNVGVVYSKNGFGSPADSTEVSGMAKTPSGPMAGFANGTTLFNTWPVTPQVVVANNDANTFRYAIPLNGATGVTITPGQTLTLRVYLSCSSSSTGRYALMRDVALKSQQVRLATRPAVQTNLAAYPNPVQNQLTVPHPAASREARVTVFSATGARVASFATQPGTTQTAIDLGSLARGLYLVEYADGVQRSSARIAKE
ncbi:MAG: T9SS type A sorting domain-containing protein [Bacteroidota bacterium]|nr:T9SS type A sorting domain-containing protein [Bacteroidota bacterium]